MGLLAVYIAHLVKPATARSVFVFVNLILFFSSFCLPDQGFLSIVKMIIPSYQWLSISYDLSMKNSISYVCLFGLIGNTILFYVLANYAAKKAD